MKVKFFTLGCKVNQYETQALKERFLSLGHEISKKKADLYIINTCSVTHRADVKSKEAVLKAKKENPQAKIAVAGCLAELNGDFIERLRVDYIIPQSKKHQLVNIILGLPFNQPDDTWSLKVNESSNHRAYVKIQDGCDNFCSFCKIPFLRGRSRSRKVRDIIDEIERLSLIYKEIVLCGVNLGLYGRDLDYNLSDLVEKILSLPHLGRLRLSSLEPFFVDKRLFLLLKNKKFCPHFHFPFQYGDDKVLGLMNKKESVRMYEGLVNSARAVYPDTAISCDIIVGLPNETEETFKNTVKFLKRIMPMHMHIFTFSPRDKTAFSGFKTKGHREIRKRYDYLRSLADDFSNQYKNKFIGKTLDLITEEKVNNFISGHTENYLKVYIKEKVVLGKILPVKINKIEKDKIFGSICN